MLFSSFIDIHITCEHIFDSALVYQLTLTKWSIVFLANSTPAKHPLVNWTGSSQPLPTLSHSIRWKKVGPLHWNNDQETFHKIFRLDLMLASLFRNYFLAERILRSLGRVPVTYPKLPPAFQHPMWKVGRVMRCWPSDMGYRVGRCAASAAGAEVWSALRTDDLLRWPLASFWGRLVCCRDGLDMVGLRCKRQQTAPPAPCCSAGRMRVSHAVPFDQPIAIHFSLVEPSLSSASCLGPHSALSVFGLG